MFYEPDFNNDTYLDDIEDFFAENDILILHASLLLMMIELHLRTALNTSKLIITPLLLTHLIY